MKRVSTPTAGFRTGDLVRVDDDGFVYFLGRLGSMIKTAGANVSPGEVERRSPTWPDWSRTSSVSRMPSGDRVVAAAVLADEGQEFDEADLRERLRTELSAYKIPRRFIVVTELP